MLALHQVQRRQAVAGAQHMVARGFQGDADALHQVSLVIDDQDGGIGRDSVGQHGWVSLYAKTGRQTGK